MSASEFKNLKTQEIRQGINFGGPKVYLVDDTPVYAPEGGTSISLSGTTLTLNPLGLTSDSGGAFYSKISEQIVGDGTWTITVKNSATGDEVSGVYEFSSEAYYTTECDRQNVLANCGGYKVEDTWDGKATDEWKRLVHTDNTLPHEILPYKCQQDYFWNGSTCAFSGCYTSPTASSSFSSVFIDSCAFGNSSTFMELTVLNAKSHTGNNWEWEYVHGDIGVSPAIKFLERTGGYQFEYQIIYNCQINGYGYYTLLRGAFSANTCIGWVGSRHTYYGALGEQNSISIVYDAETDTVVSSSIPVLP